MEMTNGEIVTSYRQAKHKTQQIGILAELNRCSNKKIIGILLNAGFSPKCFNRMNKQLEVNDAVDELTEGEIEETAEQEQEEPETEAQAEPMPLTMSDKDRVDVMFDIINGKIQALKGKRKIIQSELNEVDKQLAQYVSFFSLQMAQIELIQKEITDEGATN